MRDAVVTRLGLLAAAALLTAACQVTPAESPTAPSTPGTLATATTSEVGAPPPFVLPQPDWQVACEAIDAESCRLMAQNVNVSQRPGTAPVRTVLVRCTTPPCTPAEGNGETILLYADGSSESVGGWGYGSAVPGATPAPPPAGDWELVCEGIARSQCEEFAGNSFDSIDDSEHALETLRLTCISESCTAQAGHVRAMAHFADGSEQLVEEWDYIGSGP
jgi:hypothetical protein